jgi:hypothetical protein
MIALVSLWFYQVVRELPAEALFGTSYSEVNGSTLIGLHGKSVAGPDELTSISPKAFYDE